MKAEHILDGVITLFLLPVLIPLWIYLGIKWILTALACILVAGYEGLTELWRMRP